jgi:hypothetical protein
MGHLHITDYDLEEFGMKIQDARKIYNYLYIFLFLVSLMVISIIYSVK